ncbi:23S rRNA (pseudouridine1915-N3)-methyltransferase [Methylomarinovum tepidoasis]|uniref:Ribosomal RNA large subunit methyltransferase H n=1 Tax=Methylomarinovum tepidoasis TaxID=2840183 RepID=A0AAU9BZ36_9GAMM|nr:23S rRNA (pseudouridine(1915)-N(3))-methyltransferase RlmH [Methylomarinovum sp. IN45]BCX89045.1 23S rRNA (pseudouridine1915-N3)-methyltransferase [Methylomarinovum sp. IN45]
MHVHLIAVGTRMPAWVEAGFDDYRKRLPREWRLQLHEIPLRRRGKAGETTRLIETEGAQMLSACPQGAHLVALDNRGQQWSTEALAQRLADWQQAGRDLAFLIGGPEGLAPACRQQAETCWSLSKLTFPHPLVRIIVVEQLYRAWSLLRGHPYHR